MGKVNSGSADKKAKKLFRISEEELARVERLLKRSVDKEEGKLLDDNVEMKEDNPDGRE